MSVSVDSPTRAGVGFSENASSRQAGEEAARAALDQARLASCDLTLIFATSKHDPAALRNGVRSVIGPSARLFGGSAVGVITNDSMGYEGFQVGVATIATSGLQAELFIERGLPDNEYEVGVALARQITARNFPERPSLLLLYDIVKRGLPGEGLSMNMATPFLAGMEKVLGEWPVVAGGGLIGDMQFNPTFQLFDQEIEHHSAMALALVGGVQMNTIIMHGCTPSTSYKTITKAEGNIVLEFDGRPAVEIVAAAFGPDDASWKEYPLYITLGINEGDKFGAVRDEEYAVRLCMDIDTERGGLVMFGDDMQAGTEVQLMRRTLDLDYVRGRTDEVLAGLHGRTPFLALYIDCAGRAAAYCGTDFEEASGVQQVIGSRIPLLGWYVGCELAKAGPNMQSHNWTGVLSILSH
jgi:hypothetical protein